MSASHSESASESSSESSSESLGEVCGCIGALPTTITARFNGIQNGTECATCQWLNRDYTLDYKFTGDYYCEYEYHFVLDEVELIITAWIGKWGENLYSIEVWMIFHDSACAYVQDQVSYWYHQQTTPYDCDNLDLFIPLETDEAPEGCNGGTCKLISVP